MVKFGLQDAKASSIPLNQGYYKLNQHDTGMKGVARYLKGTKNYELTLGGKISEDDLIGYADADWAENQQDRKSNSGYLFKVYDALISWGCRKQTSVALSSTEAEYIALAEASQEAVCIRRLLAAFEGKMKGTSTIFEDNQSCLKLVYNKKISNRTKHVDTKYHYVKDLKEKSILDYKYCPTDQMLADMLTKPLGAVKLREMVKSCGLS